MRAFFVSLLTLALCLPSMNSEGQGRSTQREREAWQQLQTAEAAYGEEDYQGALRHLRASWLLFHAPVIRFNQGKTFEALERWHDAADAYEDYLTLAPDGDSATGLEARIAELRSRCATGPCPEVSEEELDDTGTESSNLVPITIAVVGGATLVGGFVSWGLARSNESQLANEATPLADLADIQQRAERRATIGNVLVPVGSVLVVAGVVWLIVRALRDPPAVSAGLDGVSVSF